MRFNPTMCNTLHRLDIVASIIGLVAGVFITSLYLISPTAYLISIGWAISLASLLYLIFFKSKIANNELVNLSRSKSSKYLLEATLLILLSISIVVFHASESRNIYYFLFISLCSGIVALLCIHQANRNDIIINILNIALISFNIKLAKFYFYGGSGTDYWTHLRMNEILAQNGKIEVLLDKEQFFPTMHINVAIAQIVPDLSSKDASMFSITVPLVISSIFVYLIGRELFGQNAGLLAMLIVNISDYHNYWGFSPQTTSYGVIIFFISMYILYKTTYSKNKLQWTIILFIMMFAVIIGHAVSSFILFVTLVGLLIGSLSYNLIFTGIRKYFFSPMLPIIYCITLLQVWFIANYREDGGTFFSQISSSLLYYVVENADLLNRPESVSEYQELMPPLTYSLLNNLGFSLLICLSIIGALYWLSVDFRSDETFSILICTVLLLGITYLFPFFGLRNIIPFRWYIFEYFFLSLMAAFAIIIIIQHTTKRRQMIAIFIFFSCLSFFMLTATLNNHTNHDSPLWLREYTISTTYTIQELKGAETISRHSEAAFSDRRYGNSILGNYYGLQDKPFDHLDISNRVGEAFLWRNYMENRPIRMLTLIEGYFKNIEISVILGAAYNEELEKMYNKFYENNELKAFYIS